MPHPEDYEQRVQRYIDGQANLSGEVFAAPFGLWGDIKKWNKERRAREKKEYLEWRKKAEANGTAIFWDIFALFLAVIVIFSLISVALFG